MIELRTGNQPFLEKHCKIFELFGDGGHGESLHRNITPTRLAWLRSAEKRFGRLCMGLADRVRKVSLVA